jgi:hypothetical protein
MMAIYCASVLNLTEIMKNEKKKKKILIKMNYCIIIEKKNPHLIKEKKTSIGSRITIVPYFSHFLVISY